MPVRRARWIVVVQADRSTLQPKLARGFSQAPWVDVIVERRARDRRQHHLEMEFDWRRADRRHAARETSGDPTFRLAHAGDGFHVYEAEGPAAVRCPECQVVLEFTMPRFAAPPARLELEVIHEVVKVQHVSREARHLVALQAFTATGRVLLACRIVARHRPSSGPDKHRSIA